MPPCLLRPASRSVASVYLRSGPLCGLAALLVLVLLLLLLLANLLGEPRSAKVG